MVRALVTALLGLALLAPAADAGWRLKRATQIAKYVWPDSKCVRHMQIRWTTPTPAPGDTTESLDSLAWVIPGQCVVYFNSEVGLEWQEFCRTMIHEAGHLAGYHDPRNVEDPAHSINPHSVMYAYLQVPEIDFSTGVDDYVDFRDWRCRKNGRWYLGL